MGSAGIGTSAKTPPATADSPGAMSAADKAKADAATLAELQDLGSGKLLTIAGGGWENRMMLAAQAFVPDLTIFDPLPLPAIQSGVTDAGKKGGMVTFAGAGVLLPLSLGICENPKTQKWAVAMRGRFAAPVYGKGVFWGLIKADVSAYLAIGSYYATDTTHLYLQVTAVTPAVTTWVIDPNTDNDFLLCGTGSSVIAAVAAIGGPFAEVARVSNLSTALNTTAVMGAYSTGSLGITISKLGHAYVE